MWLDSGDHSVNDLNAEEHHRHSSDVTTTGNTERGKIWEQQQLQLLLFLLLLIYKALTTGTRAVQAKDQKLTRFTRASTTRVHTQCAVFICNSSSMFDTMLCASTCSSLPLYNSIHLRWFSGDKLQWFNKLSGKFRSTKNNAPFQALARSSTLLSWHWYPVFG